MKLKISDQQDKLMNDAQSLFAKLYEQSGAQGCRSDIAGAGGSDTTQTYEGDVVDGDYKESSLFSQVNKQISSEKTCNKQIVARKPTVFSQGQLAEPIYTYQVNHLIYCDTYYVSHKICADYLGIISYSRIVANN